MAKLVTVVKTFFKNGRYRNNQVEIQIPDEAAELIRKFWNEKGIHNCATAKYLASNQCAIADLFQDKKLLDGISGMCDEEKVENEIFEHSFVDDEEDDRD